MERGLHSSSVGDAWMDEASWSPKEVAEGEVRLEEAPLVEGEQSSVGVKHPDDLDELGEDPLAEAVQSSVDEGILEEHRMDEGVFEEHRMDEGILEEHRMDEGILEEHYL